MDRITAYLRALRNPATQLQLLMLIGGVAVAWALLCATQAPPKPWEDDGPRYLIGEMADFKPSFPPEAVPNLRLDSAEGPVRLSDYADGRVLVVNLWATWCAPCVEELPSLAVLQGELGDAVRVLAVAEEGGDGAKQRQMLTKVGAEGLTVLLDPQLTLGRSFTNDLQLPITVIYGVTGIEVGRLYGPADWSSEEALRLVRAAASGRIRR